MDLSNFLDEARNMKLHPIFDDNLEYKFLFQETKNSSFFSDFVDEIQLNSHSFSGDIFSVEKFHSVSEESFKNYLCQKTGQGSDVATVVFTFGIILDNCKISKGYWRLFELFDKIKDCFIKGDSIQIGRGEIDNFYSSFITREYHIRFRDAPYLSSNWNIYFLNINIQGIELTEIGVELLKTFKKLIIADDESIIDNSILKNGFTTNIVNEYIYDYAKLKCNFNNEDVSFLKNITNLNPTEKKAFAETIGSIINIEKTNKYNNYERYHLIKLFSRIDSSLISQTFILSRTNFGYFGSDYQFDPLEFAIGLLRYHIEGNNSNRSTTGAFYPKSKVQETREDLLKFVEFLKYLEGIAFRSYSYESDNYSQRAIEAGNLCLDWIECFIYYIVSAFSKDIPQKIEEIISLIANDAILTRLEFYSATKFEDNYKETGCVIDNILRNTGKRESIDSPSISRDLFFPYTNIMGTTWLNDFKIENILYNAAQNAERAFSKSYTTSFFEREDDLIRDLFDEFLGKEFENAIEIINSYDQKKSKGKWTLKWNKLRLIEEKIKGADIALKVKVDVENYLQFEKIIFIQVKALAKSKNKLVSNWKIDQEQLNNLLNLSDYSFYLLLTDSFLSLDQRIIPASLLNSILKSSGKKVTLSDSKAVLGSRSLAHFLIYEVLSGWQGTQNMELINWNDNREGIKVRYVLELELGRKRTGEKR